MTIDCSKLKKNGQTVLVATGSFSPITHMHLRLLGIGITSFDSLELARDRISDLGLEVSGAFLTPVSDHYNKSGLIPFKHRVEMCKLAVKNSDWINVDEWECYQPSWSTTRIVLESIEDRLKKKGFQLKPMLVVGSDIINSFKVPNLWALEDLDKILGYYGCAIVERIDADISDYIFEDPIMYKHRVIDQLLSRKPFTLSNNM